MAINVTYNPQGGGLGNFLQGSVPTLQGSAPQLQGTPTNPNPAPKPKANAVAKKPVVSNPAATSPKASYIDNATFNATNPQVDSSGQPFAFMNQGNTAVGNAEQTAAITPPDPYGAYKTAAQSYFNSLNPSGSTTSAKQKYADFIANANLGISNLEGQGRGIPLSLVRGQQEKLYNQSQIEANRLQTDVGLAQEADTATANQAKARMDFEQSLLKPVTSPVNVAAGSSLVDPTSGKVLYQAPAKEDNPTGIIGEYNDALRLGLIDKSTTLQQFVNDRKPVSLSTTNVYGQDLSNTLKELQIQQLMGGNDTQRQAAGYALRIQQSGDVLSGLENTMKGYNAIGFETQMKLPSYLQSGNIQQYDQAARNFINAVLRRESGAAISTGEFDNAYKQYLPRPGDSDATISQKRQNRQAVYQSLIYSAGNAAGGLGLGGGTNNNTSGGSGSNPLGLPGF